ncbi:MAG TPA: hypothetical protein VEK15_09320 [Vicinamibacteria bacterium]|nr:hypothetical protein [Vicinamibacteria bacterium]
MLLLLALTLFGPADDAEAARLIRRVIDARERQLELEHQYAFREQTTTRDVADDGRVRRAKSETFLVTPAPGGEYRRLVERNGRPLDEKDQASEERKFQEFLAEQSRSSPEELAQKTNEKIQKRAERWQTRLEEALEVFEFTSLPNETLEGVAVRVFDFEPKPGYEPDSRPKKILARLEGRIWIDGARDQIARLRVRFRENLKFLGGIFGRVSEGSEAIAVGFLASDELWLLDRIEASLDARLYFLKEYRQEIVIDYSDYERLTVATDESVALSSHR